MKEVLVAPIALNELNDEPAVGAPLVERNVALLGHVTVRLELLIGSAQVSVERLFSLAKGDALELDTHLDDPVSLLLDGKPVARGHLMAAGDRFGLKITEIL